MFNVSTKTQYALGLLQILAERYGQGYISIKEVAKLKKYSGGYLQEIIVPLKKAKLIKSKEGLGGGYCLAKEPSTISLLQILELIEGPLEPVKCVNQDYQCPRQSHCTSRDIWHESTILLRDFFSCRTVADLKGRNILVTK